MFSFARAALVAASVASSLDGASPSLTVVMAEKKNDGNLLKKKLALHNDHEEYGEKPQGSALLRLLRKDQATCTRYIGNSNVIWKLSPRATCACDIVECCINPENNRRIDSICRCEEDCAWDGKITWVNKKTQIYRVRTGEYSYNDAWKKVTKYCERLGKKMRNNPWAPRKCSRAMDNTWGRKRALEGSAESENAQEEEEVEQEGSAESENAQEEEEFEHLG